MKVLHTSDWQIGMRADSVGAVASRVRSERLDAAKRVIDLAHANKADIIVLTGDTFEDNAVDRLLVRKVGEILRSFKGRVFIIPGNHDPYGPGCVWDHGIWKELQNVTVFRTSEPYHDQEFTLYPCPLKEKYSAKNPTAWIDATSNQKISIGLAHGNVEGLPNGELDYPILRDASRSQGLDYLALGHWHSFATYPSADGVCRMAYSGTHETTKFGERDSGSVVLVEIQGRGDAPLLTPLKTGKLDWTTIERRIDQPGMLLSLASEIDQIVAPENTLIRVKIEGLLFPEDRDQLARLEDILSSRFMHGTLDTSGLIPRPNDENWIAALPLGPFRDAAFKLRTQASTGSTEEARVIATQALLQLFDIQGKAAS